MRKALTAGLFMNAAKLVDTAYDPRQPNSAGINTYRIVRSTGPGEWEPAAGMHGLADRPCVLPAASPQHEGRAAGVERGLM